MILKIQLAIKFRALFVDIYKIDKTFELPLPVPAVAVPSRVLFQDKGVFLKVWA